MAEEKNTSIFGSSEDERKKYEAEQLANLFDEAPNVGDADERSAQPSEKRDASVPVGDADERSAQPSDQPAETSPLSEQLPKESEIGQAERKVPERPAGKQGEELAEKVMPKQILQKAQQQQHAELDSQMEQLGKYGASGSQLEKATEEARQVEAGGKPVQTKQRMQVHPSGTDNQNVRARETTNRIKGKRSKTTVAQKAVSEAKKGVMRTVIEDVVLPNQVPILGPGMWWGWKALKRIIGG